MPINFNFFAFIFKLPNRSHFLAVLVVFNTKIVFLSSKAPKGTSLGECASFEVAYGTCKSAHLFFCFYFIDWFCKIM